MSLQYRTQPLNCYIGGTLAIFCDRPNPKSKLARSPMLHHKEKLISLHHWG
ncbi:hypothetical protein H6F61_19810 [Cyanobacteria bacterium FACHB-472]|nr:hypothetical protein [Cyanobacteria bacterium FACHB-472]